VRSASAPPYERRPPRRDDGGDAQPRYRRADDDRPRSTRSASARPYERRPRRDDDGDDAQPRYRRSDDRPRSTRSASARPYERRPPRRDDAPSTMEKLPAEKISGEMRLNKYIAHSGICSRREADDYITAGVVSVNGIVITEMGFKVQPGDDVRFNGERIKGETKVYILMNKPKDVVTTTADPHAERTVIDLLGDKCTQRVFPVGRLDKNTTGVLLLTNDGALTEQLTHPSYNKRKIYDVFLNRKVKVADLRQLIDGVELEDGPAQADHVEYVGDDKSEVGLEIHSGRNRVVRRMFEALGYHIEKLDRVYFAGLTKKNLKRGQWRFLTAQEISMLRMGSYE
jgi:23S rRNA pseudouridine2605 synthase